MINIKICGIYKITSPSGRIYIGKSTDVLKRWKGYGFWQCKNQKIIYSSFKKYGFDAHIFEVIEECEVDILSKRETFWILNLKSNSPTIGMNLTGGGEGPEYLTAERKEAISKLHKGNKYSLGRKTSEETKEKLRKIMKLRVFTDSHRKKISDSKIGVKHSSAAIEKIKEARSKQIIKPRNLTESEKLRLRSAMLGKKHTDETKKLVSDSLKKQWESGIRKRAAPKPIKTRIKIPCAQISLDGTIINTFESITLAAKVIGIRAGNISKCITGKSKTAGGFKFKLTCP